MSDKRYMGMKYLFDKGKNCYFRKEESPANGNPSLYMHSVCISYSSFPALSWGFHELNDEIKIVKMAVENISGQVDGLGKLKANVLNCKAFPLLPCSCRLNAGI